MATRRRQLGPRLLWALERAGTLMAAHGLLTWTFRFNTNLRRAGVCHYPTPTCSGRIELSAHFDERTSDEEVVDTLLHEIAHALVGPRHGHDAVWRAKCLEVGARPVRCYGGGVDMPPGKWRATCPSCSTEYNRHRRPRRLGGWFCRACGPVRGPIRWRLAG
jgi:predicted SprT family Zn-dependent metalloprotease